MGSVLIPQRGKQPTVLGWGWGGPTLRRGLSWGSACL